MKCIQIITLFITALTMTTNLALASDSSALTLGGETPDRDAIIKGTLYPGIGYSPYAQRSFPSNVYWG